MLTQFRRARFVRYVVVPTLLVLVSGCQKWVDIELGPQLPDRVRVTQGPTGVECSREAPRFEVYTPTVVGDTLTGRATKETITVQPLVAVSDICGLEGRGGDTFATVAVTILLLGVVAVGAMAIAVCADDFFDC
jgi:hypothetical protein